MTPLASHLARQIIARPKHRDDAWRDEGKIAFLRSSLSDIHCFEVSACIDLMLDMVGSAVADWAPEKTEQLWADYAFLPAPKTWIEWKGRGTYLAVLFEQDDDWRARGTFFCHKYAKHAGYASLTDPMLYDNDGNKCFPSWAHEPHDLAFGFMTWAHAMLPLLNSPHVIGRQTHNPNRNLERKLARGAAGSFPLRAWTELKLEVNKPIDIDDGEPHETCITGRRAFHFVRKHLRLRQGRLEFVKAHWRGDIALGVKQTRYLVTPSRSP